MKILKKNKNRNKEK